jgi:hypothetical protein
MTKITLGPEFVLVDEDYTCPACGQRFIFDEFVMANEVLDQVWHEACYKRGLAIRRIRTGLALCAIGTALTLIARIAELLA